MPNDNDDYQFPASSDDPRYSTKFPASTNIEDRRNDPPPEPPKIRFDPVTKEFIPDEGELPIEDEYTRQMETADPGVFTPGGVNWTDAIERAARDIKEARQTSMAPPDYVSEEGGEGILKPFRVEAQQTRSGFDVEYPGGIVHPAHMSESQLEQIQLAFDAESNRLRREQQGDNEPDLTPDDATEDIWERMRRQASPFPPGGGDIPGDGHDAPFAYARSGRDRPLSEALDDDEIDDDDFIDDDYDDDDYDDDEDEEL